MARIAVQILIRLRAIMKFFTIQSSGATFRDIFPITCQWPVPPTCYNYCYLPYEIAMETTFILFVRARNPEKASGSWVWCTWNQHIFLKLNWQKDCQKDLLRPIGVVLFVKRHILADFMRTFSKFVGSHWLTLWQVLTGFARTCHLSVNTITNYTWMGINW